MPSKCYHTDSEILNRMRKKIKWEKVELYSRNSQEKFPEHGKDTGVLSF